MTATGHALIGTVIAAKIGNPALAIPIALASHVVADAFPHWDTGTNRKKKHPTRFLIESGFDVLVGFILSYLMIQFLFPTTSLIYAFIIIIAAQFFDWLTAPYLFFNWNIPPFSWAYKLQTKFDNKLNNVWGIVGQVAAVMFLIYVASNF